MSAILACTDGSLYAPSIYQHAGWLASRSGATIHVLHVIERHESTGLRDLSGSIGFNASAGLLEELASHDHAQARIARLRGEAILGDAIRELAGHDVRTTQRHGSVVETVDEFEDGAELVIIGKRGEHADFAKGHLGSNLERVLRGARIPVLVAARDFQPIRRFLIAFDGGPSSLRAVEHVATRAWFQGLECHLVMCGGAERGDDPAFDSAVKQLQDGGLTVIPDRLPGEADEVIAAEVAERDLSLIHI